MLNDINIVAIERKCRGEIIRYVRKSDNEVIKQYYDFEMNLKREQIQNVTDKGLIHRMAMDTQDFMLNMIENFEFKEV